MGIVPECGESFLSFWHNPHRKTSKLLIIRGGECGESFNLKSYTMQKKLIFSNDDIRLLISECSSFKELNSLLEGLIILKNEGHALPEGAIRFHTKLFYLNIPLKDEQRN